MDKQCMNDHCSTIMACMSDCMLKLVAAIAMLVFHSPIAMCMAMVSIMLGVMSCGTMVCMAHKGHGHYCKDDESGKSKCTEMGKQSNSFSMGQQIFLMLCFILGLFLG